METKKESNFLRKVKNKMLELHFWSKKIVYFCCMKLRNHFSLAKTFLYISLIISIIFITSCARGISPYEAANGKAKCGTYLK
jgi:hypothetical protein